MTYKKVLITTAIDYTNDVIHVGHAYQKVLADCFARYYRLKLGKENVKFLTGTDEHGQKVAKAAKEANEDPKAFVDRISALDKEEQDSLNISYDRFIRTTDADHKKMASDFMQKVYENGFIYKGTYNGLYCEGCEAYKTEKDLVNNACEFHPYQKITKLSEENYFFKWKSFGPFLKKLFKENPQFVLPKSKYNEMYSFLKQGVQDIPISRPSITWGITVPFDEKHVIYVWFDALINYYTYGSQTGFWDKETKIIHFLGKDNSRWHALLWPAMLKAANLKTPDLIYVNSFLSLNGKKISKSLGNVIKPSNLCSKFGSDAVRYYLLRYGPLLEDTDISEDKIKETYKIELANNLGNLISRLAKLLEGAALDFTHEDSKKLNAELLNNMENFRPDLALQRIQLKLNALNKTIQEGKPWDKPLKERIKFLHPVIQEIYTLIPVLELFIPKTAGNIKEIFQKPKIEPIKPLFPKIS